MSGADCKGDEMSSETSVGKLGVGGGSVLESAAGAASSLWCVSTWGALGAVGAGERGVLGCRMEAASSGVRGCLRATVSSD